jgi:amino-acid N-acetyltransferase
MNVPVDEVQDFLDRAPDSVDEQVRSKARYAVRAIASGIPRAHILDGRLPDGLLTELFSSVGIGTMIYGNEYQQIRPAVLEDAQTIYNITRNAVKSEMLTSRTRESIERHIGEYFVYEIDGSVLAVARLREYPDQHVAEIASVYVQPFYTGRGAGQSLVDYATRVAATRGYPRVVALTTQTAGFFQGSGFDEGTVADLPPARAQELAASGRNSKIFVKLTAEAQPTGRHGS